MPSSDLKPLKVGKRVEARTIRGTEYHKGSIVEVGERGWYTVRSKTGGTFKTRRSCIK